MMRTKKVAVYFDVENTLEVPFITGIQRVTREFAKHALAPNASESFEFIPIILDRRKCGWRPLSATEKALLLQQEPRSLSFKARLRRKLTIWVQSFKFKPIKGMAPNSIFLDIDSSWHNPFTRTLLLPQMSNAGLTISKLHYDLIPVTQPGLCHVNTTKKFSEHFHSHLKHCRLFMCISEFTRTELTDCALEQGVTNLITTTIRLGCYPSDQQKVDSKNSATTEYIKAKYGRFILVVGTIEPRKNHQTLLQAMKTIFAQTELNLVLIGKPGWRVDSILSEIMSHPLLNTRLFHLSSASDDTLDSFYRSAWLSVVPSIYEGFGLPVVESLSRACPTLSSSAASLPEVGKAFVDYFTPTSSNELARKIIGLNCDPGAYAKLAQAASDFEPSSWATTFEDIHASLLTHTVRNQNDY